MTLAGSHPTAGSSPPLHWHQPHPFSLPPLGAGVDADRQAAIAACLERLSREPGVAALVIFGSRARDAARPDSDLDLLLIRREAELDGAMVQRLWWQHLQQVWDLPLGLDLVVVGREEADRLAGSRWHAIGYAALEGKVVYVAE